MKNPMGDRENYLTRRELGRRQSILPLSGCGAGPVQQGGRRVTFPGWRVGLFVAMILGDEKCKIPAVGCKNREIPQLILDKICLSVIIKHERARLPVAIRCASAA
jgi:hypothetical protein